MKCPQGNVNFLVLYKLHSKALSIIKSWKQGFHNNYRHTEFYYASPFSQAVQEQSLRIKQLEAENTALTRERGYARGQQQQHKAAAGHPVIKTSALQSVV